MPVPSSDSVTITIKGNTIQYQDYQWRMPTKVTMPGATRTQATERSNHRPR